MKILGEIKEFLKRDLKLDLSENKTLITNANSERALFLGTEIFRTRHQKFSRKLGFPTRTSREVRLEAPLERIVKKLTEAKFVKNEIPLPRFL